MGQHKRPNDINKRPTTHATKPLVNYVQIGRNRKQERTLAFKIKSPKANNKESR